MDSIFRQLQRIRMFEERVQLLKEGGEVPGSIHLCNGQEAIPVGVCSVLGANDLIAATYRGHGWAIARGIEMAQLFAEIMGRRSSLNGGRAGSPFLSSLAQGFIGENSIVGAGVPIAAGAALTAKIKSTGQVVVVSIGDGAVNQGVVPETLNLAAVLVLPLIIVVENNVYSEMSPIKDMMRNETLVERAAAFGILGLSTDGNDTAAVTAVAQEAVDRARSGKGPTLIEAKTARLVGHYSGDVQQYRPIGDLDLSKQDEPIARLKAKADLETAARYLKIESKIVLEIENALAIARELPEPDPSTATDHVYV
jgi:TPP-dependent pyruvate/acetoin dehydrogenase alpha subunit